MSEAVVSSDERPLKRCRTEGAGDYDGTFLAVKDPEDNHTVHSFQVPPALVTAIEASDKVDTSGGVIMYVEDASDVAAVLFYLINLPSLDEEEEDTCDEEEDDECFGLGEIKNESLRALAEKCIRVKAIPRRSDMVFLVILNQ